MHPFIIAPKIVADSLNRPIALEREWKIAQGQAPDGSEATLSYAPQEHDLIHAEADRLYPLLSDHCTKPGTGSKRLILTAGAPGAGKTVLLNQWVQARPADQRGIYIDPDETILKAMIPYQEDLASGDPVLGTLSGAYGKWRAASNYIAGTLINRACADGYDIVYGTTATSPSIKTFYENAKAAGYETTTLIVAAPEDVRRDSVRIRYELERDRFTPVADVVAKGRMFYERLPLYFDLSDHFQLYWRDQVNLAPKCFAWGSQGRFWIDDKGEMDFFEGDLAVEKTGLDWCKLVTRYLQRYPDNGYVPHVPPGAPAPA